MRHILIGALALLLSGCSESSSDNEVMTGDDAITLTSPAVVNGELLTEFQCEVRQDDGTENSIPLKWSNIPNETKSLAIVMYHYPNPNDTTTVSSYLSLWGIDPEVTEIPYATADDGPWFMGANKDGVAISYTSPCSPSIGSHSYTIALYALSSDPVASGLLPAESSLDVAYASLLAAAEAAGIISQAELVFNSTTGDTTDESSGGVTASSCEDYAGAFAPLSDLVSYECGDTFLSLTSDTGLPPTQNVADGEDIMVGLTSWIQRVPVPFAYEWMIPLDPAWSNVTTEASARGPIAVAVDGVPIFHYERRPDVSTALAAYTEENDTVVAGELDQCGGHAGQGDDYHYHYAPVCLLDDHDLTQPIAFGLDGAPVYFGEAGTDYYGNGRFNDLNNFPVDLTAEELDECNAVLLDDGSYAHYSTKTPPYLIGCHHAPFDTALQIEPAPMTGRNQGAESPLGGQYGEPASTLVTGFSLSDDGQYTMEFDALDGSGLTSSVIYSKSSTTNTVSCWDFEFRVDAGQAGEVSIACREDVSEALINGVQSLEHGHTH